MFEYVNYVLQECLCATNILNELQFLLIYEFTSLVLQKGIQEGKIMNFEHKILEKLVFKMIIHLLENYQLFEHTIPRVFRQFLELPEFPEDLACFLNEKIRDKLPQIHKLSSKVAELMVLSWSALVSKNSMFLDKLLNAKNMTFFFSMIENYKTNILKKQNTQTGTGYSAQENKNQGIFVFQIFQFLSIAIFEMSDIERNDFCNKFGHEISKFTEFLGISLTDENILERIVVILCATHFSMQEGSQSGDKNLISDAIQKTENFDSFYDNQILHANSKRKELFQTLLSIKLHKA